MRHSDVILEGEGELEQAQCSNAGGKSVPGGRGAGGLDEGGHSQTGLP